VELKGARITDFELAFLSKEFSVEFSISSWKGSVGIFSLED
jgi:hypothetical protein